MPRVQGIRLPDGKHPDVGIYSFGVKSKTLPKAQFEFDVTNFRDPSGQKQFRGLCGMDPAVVTWVAQDPKVQAIVDQVRMLVADLRMPITSADGKSTSPRSQWISFSFKDYHGKMIAPAVAEYVAATLDKDLAVMVQHYGLMEAGK